MLSQIWKLIRSDTLIFLYTSGKWKWRNARFVSALLSSELYVPHRTAEITLESSCLKTMLWKHQITTWRTIWYTVWLVLLHTIGTHKSAIKQQKTTTTTTTKLWSVYAENRRDFWCSIKCLCPADANTLQTTQIPVLCECEDANFRWIFRFRWHLWQNYRLSGAACNRFSRRVARASCSCVIVSGCAGVKMIGQ